MSTNRSADNSHASVPASADDPAESQRFIDMAREVGVDESPEAFERAFGKVTRPPKPAPKLPD